MCELCDDGCVVGRRDDMWASPMHPVGDSEGLEQRKCSRCSIYM